MNLKYKILYFKENNMADTSQLTKINQDTPNVLIINLKSELENICERLDTVTKKLENINERLSKLSKSK